jgi:hypothetical protein
MYGHVGHELLLVFLFPGSIAIQSPPQRTTFIHCVVCRVLIGNTLVRAVPVAVFEEGKN